jgi:hypothetical protein
LSVDVNFPTPDNYDKWDVWGKAVIKALQILFAYTQVITDITNISSFPSSVTPNGWLKCNGSTFDKFSYPVLFTMLGTTTLPNLTSPFGAGYTVWIKAG